MFFIKKYAIPASFSSIMLVFVLHKIPISDLFLRFTNAYQSNLVENILIHCFALVVILIVMMRVGIPLGVKSVQYKLFPYYLPLIFFVIIFSGGLSGGTNNATNFHDLNFALFTIEALSSSFLEEFLFRGLIVGLLFVKYLDSKNGILKVVTYSSVLFGSAHLLNFWSQEDMPLQSATNQLFATTCLGFMMCAIYLKTGNIIILAAAHFCSNFLAGLPFVGKAEMVQQSIQSSGFALKTLLEEFFRLVLFGWPLLIGLLILNRVNEDEVERLLIRTKKNSM